MKLELGGRAALVTGGSRGIGRAIARELALEGVEIAICARGEARLRVVADEIGAESGRKVLPLAADVTSKEQVDRAVDAAANAFGRLDILVNNAGQPGGLARGPLPEVRDEDLLQDLNVKALGYLRCTRAAAPHMQRQGWGRVINIGGLSGRQPGTYSTGMRNIAIVHMTKTLAIELGRSGITVNVVHPGTTRSEWAEERWASLAEQRGTTVDEVERQEAEQHVSGRIVDAREVAYVVTFLASPKAASITGEVVGVGGGEPRGGLFI